MAEGTGRGERLSIWFFVGMLTVVYGLNRRTLDRRLWTMGPVK